MTSVVAAALVLAGAGFTMLAGIGALRFRDAYSRMHPAAKGPTLGLLLVATGTAIELGRAEAVLTLALVVVLQFLAAPVGAHLLGRAIHQRVALPADQVDELASRVAVDEPPRDEPPSGRSDRSGGGPGPL